MMRIAIVGLLVSAACGSDSAPTPQDPDDPNAPDAASIDPTDGPAQYAANCASCHGSDGAGTNLAPTILNPVKDYATYVVRTGRNEMGFPNGGMTAFDSATLADVQLGAILDFLAAAPKPTTGDGLYARFCTNCHGADAKSGRVGKNIVFTIFEINDKVRSGHGGTNYGARGDYMPAWDASEITGDEITLIRQHIVGF